MFIQLFVMLSTSFAFSEMKPQESACDVCNCSLKTVVDCSFRGLLQIPSNISADTTVLDMSSNLINTLDRDPFKKLRNLLVLDLYNNSLKSKGLSNSTFSGLSKLKVLNISKNDQLQLTNATTPLELFKNMPSLELLKMYGTTGTYNIMHGYPDVQLSKLKSLRELWIDGLTNIAFGLAFRNMTSLKVLRLAGDHIKPSWRSKEFCMTNLVKGMFDNLPSITHLFIRKCNLETADVNVFQKLQNLEYLDLSKNTNLTLRRLSSALGSLQNKTNTLVLNEIESSKPHKYTVTLTTDMVESLQYIPLRELHLDNNRIELIEPGVFKKLPKTLQIVSAKQNRFFTGYYIFSVRYLENLRYLDISHQFFTSELEVWHQSETHNTNLDENHFTENIERNLNKSQIMNKTYGPQTERSHRLETDFDKYTDTESRHYDNTDKYTGIETDSYNQRKSISSTKTPEKGTYEMNRNLSRRDILHYMTSTCPQHSKEFYIPPGTIVGYIPPKLEYLDISISKHANPVFQLIFSENNSLKILNASQSLLYCLEGPVRGLHKLEYLDLSENYCYNISKTFFKYASSLKSLYIHKNFLGQIFGEDYDGEILQPLSSLDVVNISYNRIYKIPRRFFMSQRNLVSLSAVGNVIEEFDVTLGHMTRLRNLQLRLNYINTLSDVTRGELEKLSSQIDRNTNQSLLVDLSVNPIHCYCSNVEFLKWVFKHSSSDSALVVQISECLFHENQTRVKLYSRKHLEDTVAYLEKQCQSYLGLIVGLSIFMAIVVNIILGIIIHKNRWQLQYWYYVVLDNYRCKVKLRRTNYEELDDMYKYDVFVASAAEDVDEQGKHENDFVMDKLRPVLKLRNLIAFVQVYHIQGNDNLISMVGKAINASRVVLFIFSDDWSKDDSMKVAVHMWQCDMMQRRCPNSVFGIRLNEMCGKDAEMMHDIHCKTVLDYPKGANRHTENAFWRECTDLLQKLGKINSNQESSDV